jgi:diacylglycerol kinase family enzyme
VPQNILPVILNPTAGRGAEREADALRDAFSAVGTTAEIHVVPGPEVQQRVKALTEARVPVIAIAGGDGTLSSATSILARSESALLPIPLGTRNHFAQRYGLPTVAAAVHAWERHHAHPVPVGFMNDVAFINNASCGFYPHLVRRRDRLERAIPRGVAGWVAGWIVLAQLPLMRLEITAGTERRLLKTPALWVGIGKNSLRLPRPGDVVREGNVLEMVTPTTQRRTRLIGLMMRTMVKLKRGAETPEDAELDVLHAAAFTLDSPHRIDVGIDGEPNRFRPPLSFRYVADGLKVLCLVAPS